MFVFKSAAALAQHLRQIRTSVAQPIGFAPTMGALHNGHLRLIESAKHHGCYVVCSIYVNPTQFNNMEDFARYPITIEADMEKLAAAGCDVLFLPDNKEMYGAEVRAEVYDYGSITANYEGALRPGHFDGVITIVGKLFNMVNPDYVFFGQKDLQQCMVIRNLIKAAFPGIQMELVPTVREADGLAMSSRNVRLSETERQTALSLSAALFAVKQMITNGESVRQALASATAQYLQHPLLKLEYLDVVQSDTMTPVDKVLPGTSCAVIIACWCASVRLIDNVLLTD